jgi:peptidoglycan/LPS O-acetylase OafA/YrhL
MGTPSNNFNIMRLIAAWLILFGHCYGLYDHSADPIHTYLKLPGSSYYALACFFTISGYLVTSSWQRQPDLFNFSANRILRIFPGLMVTILLTTFVVGPVVTTLPAADYFTHSNTWKYLRGLFVFGLRYELPGVFETVPYAGAVNGSLWSLKLELQYYIILALLALAGLLKPRIIPLLAIGCLLCNLWLAGMAGNPPKEIWGMKYSNMTNFTLWGFFFWAGSSLLLLKNTSLFSPALKIAIPVLALTGYYFLPYGYYIHTALMPYIILSLGLRPSIIPSRWLKENDLSYGVYLYAFPVQQCYMLYIGNNYGISGFIIASTVFTLVLAWLSWRLVESPALRLKPSRRTTAVAAAA